MSHRPKPTAGQFGGSMSSYFDALALWNSQHKLTPQGGIRPEPGDVAQDNGPDGLPRLRSTINGRTIYDFNYDGRLDAEDAATSSIYFDDPDSGGGGGGASGPRSVGDESQIYKNQKATDLQFLKDKYPIDEKLLMKEFELQNKGRAQDFLNSKELAALDQRDRLIYLRENIKLTRQMELEMIAASHKNNLELQKDQQLFDSVMQDARLTHDKEMQENQFGHEKELREEDRKLDRQKMVVDLLKDNPVQAVLMSMGLGDQAAALGGGEPLGQLEGEFFEGLEGQTESALSGIKGAVVPGAEGIDITGTGVEGLAGAHKQAASFGQGSDATKTLLTSAHSIGGSDRAGISAGEVAKTVQSVTPQGFKRAAGGIGYLPALGYNSTRIGVRAAVGVGSVAGDIGDPNPPPVEPNTAYTVGEGIRLDGSRPEVAVTGDKIGPNGNPELLGIRPLTEGQYGSNQLNPLTTTYAGPDGRTNIPPTDDGTGGYGGGFIPPNKTLPGGAGQALPGLGTQLQDPRDRDPLAGGFVPPGTATYIDPETGTRTDKPPIPNLGDEVEQPRQQPQEVLDLQKQLQLDIDELLAPQGTSLDKFRAELEESRANGTPFTPRQKQIIEQIKTFQKEQSIPRMQQARKAAQIRQLRAEKQLDYTNRRTKYLQSLPPEQRRRVQAREIERGKEEAAKSIDVTKLGPEVIQQLISISNDPNNPQAASAGEKLGQLLPSISRDPNTVKAATGLASFLGQ